MLYKTNKPIDYVTTTLQKHNRWLEAKYKNSLGKSTKDESNRRNDAGDINAGKTFRKAFSNLQGKINRTKLVESVR